MSRKRKRTSGKSESSKRQCSFVYKPSAETDENYETMPHDIRFMLSHVDKETDVVWDPFYCSGFSGRYMEHLGYNTVHTDEDFFSYKNPPNDVTFIVSNPPFSVKHKVLNRLLKFSLPFVLLLPTCTMQRQYFRNLAISDKHSSWHVALPDQTIRFHKSGIVQPTPPFFSGFFFYSGRGEHRRSYEFSDHFCQFHHIEGFSPLNFHADGEDIGETISGQRTYQKSQYVATVETKSKHKLIAPTVPLLPEFRQRNSYERQYFVQKQQEEKKCEQKQLFEQYVQAWTDKQSGKLRRLRNVSTEFPSEMLDRKRPLRFTAFCVQLCQLSEHK